MSILTQNERDGLDDVFKSIHSSNNNYKNIKELLAFIISKIKRFKLKKFVKQAKYGTKQTFFHNFYHLLTKEEKIKQINYTVSIAELFDNYAYYDSL